MPEWRQVSRSAEQCRKHTVEFFVEYLALDLVMDDDGQRGITAWCRGRGLPQLVVEWRPVSRPTVLLQAHRWTVGSHDAATGKRLDALESPFKLCRDHAIMNCTGICPNGLNRGKAIDAIKRLIVGRQV